MCPKAEHPHKSRGHASGYGVEQQLRIRGDKQRTRYPSYMNLAITYIPMVRILILSIMILFTLRGNEVRADEKTDSIAENLLKQVVLNDDDALFYREVIQCGELTKDQLYVNVNYWFTKYFEDANAENEIVQIKNLKNFIMDFEQTQKVGKLNPDDLELLVEFIKTFNGGMKRR